MTSEAQISGRRWLPAILVCVGFAPLMYWHISSLLEKPHYQFLFLMPVVVWMLAITLDTVPLTPLTRTESLIGNSLLCIALLGLAAATWIWSPWIAACSCLIAAFALVLSIHGWRGIRNVFPLWVFSWVLIPLPFGKDEDLIVGLRDVTTRLSSSVLDQTGILHDSYANIIELPGKPLFIADACSGIHSLYVLMAASLFLAMWFRRGVVHTMCLMVSTFALVIVENVARIVSVAALWRAGYEFSIGWKHDALGVLLFCLSLGLVITSDQLLAFLLPSKAPSLLKWVYGKLSGDTANGAGVSRGLVNPARANLTVALTTISVFFPLVAIGQLVRMPPSPPNPVAILHDDFVLPTLGKEALPEDVDGFAFEAYEEIERVFGDPLGQASQQWEFRRGELRVQISIDYPYDGVHDLCECYSSIGWSISDKRVSTIEELLNVHPSADGPVAEGALYRKLYGHGLLLFNLTDMSGKAAARIKDLDSASSLARRFESFAQEKNVGNEPPPRPPLIQTQLFALSSEPISASSREDLLALFLKTRQILFETLLEEPAAEVGK